MSVLVLDDARASRGSTTTSRTSRTAFRQALSYAFPYEGVLQRVAYGYGKLLGLFAQRAPSRLLHPCEP
jgi:hypothetical protein